ncbi:MAG: sigma-70 family RNA polymerase sigma factor, partial [Peptostreptococcaceae bacterium]|nr:sigma-70 family RNA polymerase sigma factor [Peptostreptococcaceae bacterium]
MTNQELFKQYVETKDIELRNALVESYLYMVDILIRKYLNKGVDYDDLYQVGAMALVSAVDRFDPNRGFEFSSFATPTILGEIKRYFRDKEWGVKVPRRLKELSAKVPAAKEHLFGQLQRVPTVAEIAEYLGNTEEQILEAMEGGRAYNSYSLNQTFDDAGEVGENPILERYAAIDETGYDSVEYGEIIDIVLKRLSESEKYIFQKRYIQNKTQTQIAQELGVSQ